jgi:hypothetical protein
MLVEEYENIVESEVSPELQEYVRVRVISDLWTQYAAHGPVVAA